MSAECLIWNFWGRLCKMKHKVDIIVVLKKTIEVEADFESDALNQTYEKYADN